MTIEGIYRLANDIGVRVWVDDGVRLVTMTIVGSKRKRRAFISAMELRRPVQYEYEYVCRGRLHQWLIDRWSGTR